MKNRLILDRSGYGQTLVCSYVLYDIILLCKTVFQCDRTFFLSRASNKSSLHHHAVRARRHFYDYDFQLGTTDGAMEHYYKTTIGAYRKSVFNKLRYFFDKKLYQISRAKVLR